MGRIGAQGEAGPAGRQGEAGQTGPSGARGDSGAAGTAGRRGVSGTPVWRDWLVFVFVGLLTAAMILGFHRTETEVERAKTAECEAVNTTRRAILGYLDQVVPQPVPPGADAALVEAITERNANQKRQIARLREALRVRDC